MTGRRFALVLAGGVAAAAALLPALPAVAASQNTLVCPSAQGTAGKTTVTGSKAQSCGTVSAAPTDGVTVTGETDGLETGTLAVALPAADKTDHAITSVSVPAGGSKPIAIPASYQNGTYTATLHASLGGTVTATVVLAIPPSAPDIEPVDVSTPGQATVTWDQSSPTPADAYAVQVDGQATTLTPACSASTCTATVTGLSAGDHAFTVVATRAGSTVSSMSEADGKVAPVPASSAPTTGSSTAPGGSGSSGSTGSTGSTGTVVSGSGSAGSSGSTSGTGSTGSSGSSGTTASAAETAQQAAAAAKAAQQAATGFHSFAPPAGIALLPPLPQLATTGGTNPDGEPTDPGTYSPSLPYSGSVTVPETVTRTTALGHIQDVVSDRELVESIAGAVLVLLAAAHLRVLVRRMGTADL